MVSRLARRSGVAVVQIAELLQFKPDVVYHVGVGLQHAEVFIMKDECWPEVKIIGFEPNPATYKEIVDTYPGFLIPCALGNEVREGVPFYQPDKHRDGSSLFRRAASDVEYKVDITSLDVLFPLGPGRENCLLWLDAEGNDLAVLEGATNFLSGVQMINIEMTGSAHEGWADQATINRWLMDHGYRRQWVHTQRIHVGQQDVIWVKAEMLDPAICPCPCQLEGLPPRSCVGKNLLSFYEVVVHKDLTTEVKRGGRQISSDEEVVVKECEFRTQKDDKNRRKHYWRLRWCGYAVNERYAIDIAQAAAVNIQLGTAPDYVDMGENK